jgi:prepilin-type N-terminal cleavage/methylation domain-containing protein
VDNSTSGSEEVMSGSRKRGARGFSMIEVMLVVVLVGILSTFAMPRFLKASARARRSEMQGVLEKMRMHFLHQYRSNGSFTVPACGAVEWNPPGEPGSSAEWVPGRCGWHDYPFPPQGTIKMRYFYAVTDRTLLLSAKGRFPGVDGEYVYEEHYAGDVRDSQNEFPITF